jgi:hypothetical protein
MLTRAKCDWTKTRTTIYFRIAWLEAIRTEHTRRGGIDWTLLLSVEGQMYNVVSDQIDPDWDCLQANYMSSSFKTDNLICSFWILDDI